jgi:hypothetical protein
MSDYNFTRASRTGISYFDFLFSHFFCHPRLPERIPEYYLHYNLLHLHIFRKVAGVDSIKRKDYSFRTIQCILCSEIRIWNAHVFRRKLRSASYHNHGNHRYCYSNVHLCFTSPCGQTDDNLETNKSLPMVHLQVYSVY